MLFLSSRRRVKPAEGASGPAGKAVLKCGPPAGGPRAACRARCPVSTANSSSTSNSGPAVRVCEPCPNLVNGAAGLLQLGHARPGNAELFAICWIAAAHRGIHPALGSSVWTRGKIRLARQFAACYAAGPAKPSKPVLCVQLFTGDCRCRAGRLPRGWQTGSRVTPDCPAEPRLAFSRAAGRVAKHSIGDVDIAALA
jgi:hypothetical protein